MMKKIYFLILLIALVSLGTAEAKEPRLVGYQGEIRAGYSVGVGTNPTINKWGFHTIHGIRISQYFSTGVGVGLDLYRDRRQNDPSIPLFLNLKGYLPVSKMVRLFLSFDIGWTVNVSSNETGGSSEGDFRHFYTVEIGSSFKVSPKKAIYISMGYDLNRRKQDKLHGITNHMRTNCGALVFRVGFQF